MRRAVWVRAMRTDRFPSPGRRVAAGALLAGCGGDERAVPDRRPDRLRRHLPMLARCRALRRSAAAHRTRCSPARIRTGRRSHVGVGRRSARRVVRACTETGEFSTMFEQVRRLVERESVDAVVGRASSGVDGIGLREVAARLPRGDVRVPFPAARENTTLRPRAPNLYRFEADHGAGVRRARDVRVPRSRLAPRGGHGAELGRWMGSSRRHSWRSSAALGGTAAPQDRLDFIDPSGSDAQRIPADVDGVAVLTTPFIGSQGRSCRRSRVASEVLRGRWCWAPSVLNEEAALRATGRRSKESSRRRATRSAGSPRTSQSYRDAFPGLPSDSPTSSSSSRIATRSRRSCRRSSERRAIPATRGERLREALGVSARPTLLAMIPADRRARPGDRLDDARSDRADWAYGPAVARARCATVSRCRSVLRWPASTREHRPGARRRALRVATRRRPGLGDQSATAPIVHVNRVCGRPRREPAGPETTTDEQRRMVWRGRERCARARPTPSRRQRSVSPTTTRPASCRRRDERLRRRLDQERLGVDAERPLHGERGARQQAARVAPPAPVVGSGETEREPVRERQPRAELHRRPVVLGAGERDDDRVAASLAVHEDGDVARCVVEQAQQPWVLEQAIGRVDDEELGILLAREPREIGARRERGERRSTRCRRPALRAVSRRCTLSRRRLRGATASVTVEARTSSRARPPARAARRARSSDRPPRQSSAATRIVRGEGGARSAV